MNRCDDEWTIRPELDWLFCLSDHQIRTFGGIDLATATESQGAGPHHRLRYPLFRQPLLCEANVSSRDPCLISYAKRHGYSQRSPHVKTHRRSGATGERRCIASTGVLEERASPGSARGGSPSQTAL